MSSDRPSMTSGPTIRPGDLVEVDYPPGRPHIAVVLYMDAPQGIAWLVPGTGTYRANFAHIRVEQSTREGRALQLRKDTYFYQSAFMAAPTRGLRKLAGRPTPGLMQRLQEMCLSAK